MNTTSTGLHGPLISKGQVLIFRTSVQTNADANLLGPRLNKLAGVEKWNFALDDCDRILRVVSSGHAQAVVQLLLQSGFWCEELED